MLIGAPQARQRPRSASHETTGMLSYGLTGAPHDGQRDGGCASDSPRGSRYATTFRNDPMIRPPRAASTMAATMPGLSAASRTERGGPGHQPGLISRQVFWTMPALP